MKHIRTFLESQNNDFGSLIAKWKHKLELDDWWFIFISIDDEQVDYPEDIDVEDRFFIGIVPYFDTKTAEIFHGRTPTEEDILHELLHVKYPYAKSNDENVPDEDWKEYEDWIQEKTATLLDRE